MATPALSSDRMARLVPLYPVLDELGAALRARFTERALPMGVRPGTVVFDERQTCGGFPLVLDGSIRVQKTAANGRELPLYRVYPGETCVISSACLLGQVEYNARGIADGETMLVIVPLDLFDTLLAVPPFRRFVFAQFTDRVADLMQLIDAVAFRKLDQRLAAALLGRGPLVHTTHQQLADELGSVREIVTRLLKGFAEQGWVRLSREQIEILQPAALRHLAA